MNHNVDFLLLKAPQVPEGLMWGGVASVSCEYMYRLRLSTLHRWG